MIGDAHEYRTKENASSWDPACTASNTSRRKCHIYACSKLSISVFTQKKHQETAHHPKTSRKVSKNEGCGPTHKHPRIAMTYEVHSYPVTKLLLCLSPLDINLVSSASMQSPSFPPSQSPPPPWATGRSCRRDRSAGLSDSWCSSL